MLSERKIKNSFKQARADLNNVRYELWNRTRFLEFKTSEQAVRIKELERRLAQLERWSIREKVI